MSAMSAPRTLRLPAAQDWTSVTIYALPARLELNQWALSGDWTMGRESHCTEQAQRATSRTAFTPAIFISSWDRQRQERPCDFACSSMDSRRALLTGSTLTNKATARLPSQRLYQLIRQPKPIADRQFEIEFLDSGVEAFAFTFG